MTTSGNADSARVQPRPLRCPYCGSEISAVLVYASGAYSEHRDVDGYECDDYSPACGAEWDVHGNPTVVPMRREDAPA
jgi:hypothetical protein